MALYPSALTYPSATTFPTADPNTTPVISVFIGLDPDSFGNSFFLLGSDTDTPFTSPRSVLDNEVFGLGGVFNVDVTSYVTGLTISRGRSRELDGYQTGSASISFTNRDRSFDPTNTASAFYPNIVPRRQITIVAGNQVTPVFSGFVDDWNLSYDVGGQSEAAAVCMDGFGLLSKQILSAFTATSQTSGERIDEVLSRSEIAWPATARSIDTGAQTLQADSVAADTNALSYLQLVENSEPGSFFISTAGSAVFRDRNTASVVGEVVFSDAGTGIPYNEIDIVYGTELLYNSVSITRSGGTQKTASDAASIAAFGISALDENGLLLDTDDSSQSLAEFYVGKYSQPEYRFNSITVEMAMLSKVDQDTLLALDLTDVIVVNFTPNQTGSAISQNCEILGISHSIRPASHRVTFMLATTTYVAFVLDSATFGVMDDAEIVLGF